MVDKTVFNEKVLEAKSNDDGVVRMNRAVDNHRTVIGNLYDRHYHSGVLADIQYQLSFRVSEAEALTLNLDKYLDRETNIISGIKGKGGQPYPEKIISDTLISSIDTINKHISLSTYMADLKNEGRTSHDFRYSFCKNLYLDKLSLAGSINGLDISDFCLKTVPCEIKSSKVFLKDLVVDYANMDPDR